MNTNTFICLHLNHSLYSHTELSNWQIMTSLITTSILSFSACSSSLSFSFSLFLCATNRLKENLKGPNTANSKGHIFPPTLPYLSSLELKATFLTPIHVCLRNSLTHEKWQVGCCFYISCFISWLRVRFPLSTA